MARRRRLWTSQVFYHITHRCHKKEFLLKFAKDRSRRMHWLFEAKKRYGLSVLNYMITSNHVHLIVADDGGSKDVRLLQQVVIGREADAQQ